MWILPLFAGGYLLGRWIKVGADEAPAQQGGRAKYAPRRCGWRDGLSSTGKHRPQCRAAHRQCRRPGAQKKIHRRPEDSPGGRPSPETSTAVQQVSSPFHDDADAANGVGEPEQGHGWIKRWISQITTTEPPAY